MILFLTVSLLFSVKISDQFALPKLFSLRITTLLLSIIWFYRLTHGEIKIIPRHIFFPLSLLVLWWGISTCFALSKHTALHGVYGRHNGLFNYLTYLLLFLITATTPMNIKRIIRISGFFILSLIPVCIYMIVHEFQLDPIEWGDGFRFGSTFGNSVIMTAILGLGFPFLIIIFIQLNRYKKLFTVPLILIYLYAIFLSDARGPWLGIIISFLLLLFLYHYKYKTFSPKKIAVLLILLSFALFILFSLNPGALSGKNDLSLNSIVDPKRAFKKIENITSRLQSIVRQDNDKSISGRLVHYKIALNIVRDYPLFGVGLDNFRTAFPQYKLSEFDRFYRVHAVPTHVHNGYLLMALTTGIAGLLFYLLFIISILFSLFNTFRQRNSRKVNIVTIAFISSIVCYLVQDIFSWQDIALNSFYWVILGLAVSLCTIDRTEDNAESPVFSIAYIPAVLSIAFLIFLSLDLAGKMRADRLFHISRNMDVKKDWPQIEYVISEGLKKAPKESHYLDIAATFYIRRFDITREKELYLRAMSIIKEMYKINPFNPYGLSRAIELDSIGLVKGVLKHPSEFSKKGVEILKSNYKSYNWVKKVSDVFYREWAYRNVISLLDEGDVKSALTQIMVLVKAHPYIDYYYDTLGKIYLLLNDKSKADQAYMAAYTVKHYNNNNNYARNFYRRNFQWDKEYEKAMAAINERNFLKSFSLLNKFITKEEHVRALNFLTEDFYIVPQYKESFPFMDKIVKRLSQKDIVYDVLNFYEKNEEKSMLYIKAIDISFNFGIAIKSSPENVYFIFSRILAEKNNLEIARQYMRVFMKKAVGDWTR